MADFRTFRDVLGLWKTRVAVARNANSPDHPVTKNMVEYWWRANTIPEKHFWAIVHAANKCGFKEVTYKVLSDIGARPVDQTKEKTNGGESGDQGPGWGPEA